MHYLYFEKIKQDNQISKMLDFVLKEQALNKEMWDHFVSVYISKIDTKDGFWRGEYWGKAMRGACLVYQYNHSEKLYQVLKYAVSELLKTQEENGRFSTYDINKEFFSWDTWCRKYVLTGLLHFYDICYEQDFKNQVMEAIKRHADYIIAKIGNKPGQIRIVDTSEWWLGINSSSILEPFVDLYNKTNEKKYLDFASYIVTEGGIRNGNLIEEVNKGIHRPAEYPEQKAYETMSFFEGIFEYGKVVNDDELINTSLKFFEDVNKYEISIIGNAGTNEECFSDTVLNQLTKETKFMQETCVVVTWMRVLAKLYFYTGDTKYIERFLRAGLNSFYGSLNFDKQEGWAYFDKVTVKPLPFDSYSPLLLDRRGKSTGGFNFFPDGYTYGCCACIGAASAGLLANLVFAEDEKYIYINEYFNCEVIGQKFNIKLSGDYFSKGRVTVEYHSKKDLKIRIPEWSNKTSIKLNGEISTTEDKGYYLIKAGNNKIELEFDLQIKVHHLQDYVALTYGDITLGIDSESNPNINLEELRYSQIKDLKLSDNKLGNFVTLEGTYKGVKIYIKDYASCGKHWQDHSLILTAWIKE